MQKVVSDKAYRKALQIKERFELIDDKIWEGFEEEEMEEVLRGLKKICKNLEEKEE